MLLGQCWVLEPRPRAHIYLLTHCVQQCRHKSVTLHELQTHCTCCKQECGNRNREMRVKSHILRTQNGFSTFVGIFTRTNSCWL